MAGSTIILLALAAFFAGLVDSIAGGGGLISLPALLIAGLDPHLALGTNKVQSCVGTTMSTARYIKRGHLSPRIGCTAALGALIGSLLGANLALSVSSQFLQRLLPWMVAAVGAITFLKPRFGLEERIVERNARSMAGSFAIGLLLGAYDGFFGPGTGSFIAFAFVLFFGMGFLKATASAKLTNLASNVAALAAFSLAGRIFLPAALAMAVANTAGAWVGSGLAMKRGASLIKPVFGLVLVGLLVKLIFFS